MEEERSSKVEGCGQKSGDRRFKVDGALVQASKIKATPNPLPPWRSDELKHKATACGMLIP